MWHTYFNKIGLVCVLGLAACGAEKSEDPAAETAETTIDESAAKGFDLGLIGTFISDSRQPGDLTQLVLKTNNTFHSATLVVCIAPPCDPIQEDGTYRISWRESRQYITLYNVENAVIARYQFEWRDDSLHLLKVFTGVRAVPGAWLQMWLSNAAWCANPTVTTPPGSAPNDCDLQNLPIGPCAGQWTCTSNVCNWDCTAHM